MKDKILIVEDEFIIGNDLKLMLEQAGFYVTGIAESVEEALKEIARQRPDIVLLDIFLKGTLSGIDLAIQLRELNIPFVYLSANADQKVLEEAKVTQPFGFLVKPFRTKEVLIALDIAKYRHSHSIESAFRKERDLQDILVKISAQPSSWEQKLLDMTKSLQAFVPFDYLSVGIVDADKFSNGCDFYRIGFDQYQTLTPRELGIITKRPHDTVALLSNYCQEMEPSIYNKEELESICMEVPGKRALTKIFGLISALVLPVPLANQRQLVLSFYSKSNNVYTENTIDFLSKFYPYFSFLSNSIPTRSSEIPSIVYEDNSSSNSGSRFKGLIGSSTMFLKVLDLTSQVAPLDTSVLLLGESGTGKELIAQQIHQLSSRRGAPLIKVNCAALPSNLIESELFGHEKGAFTGAHNQRLGKFEQAQNGTIFLDEIGEMSVDMQVKLLRVLQEKEIERLGGSRTIKINVRVIAATNKNLEKQVSEGNFRLDLYYRLSVFPITLPPLRERKDDILDLANHFVARFSKQMGRSFAGMSETMEENLLSYSWPGNIRELENVIEQSVILAENQSKLNLMRPLDNSLFSITRHHRSPESPGGGVKTLGDLKKLQDGTEREYLLAILRQTNGRVRGESGAAELLNMKPTTLESRMARLGIKKSDI